MSYKRTVLSFMSFCLLVLTVHVTVSASELKIGPIKGLTTAWHDAPQTIVVPLDSQLLLSARLINGARLIWDGAEEQNRDRIHSEAIFEATKPGMYPLTIRHHNAYGGVRIERYQIHVVNVRAEDIVISPINLSVNPIPIDAENPNETAYENASTPSIAGLAKINARTWATSTHREVYFQADISPAEFAPMIEWRLPGKAAHLGTSATSAFPVGQFEVQAGPAESGQSVGLETYRVIITSHESGVDEIEEGSWSTFIAETEPAGYEEFITWRASTKFGECQPISGQGPVFEVRFDNTYGPNPHHAEPFQWLGVRADMAFFQQAVQTRVLAVCPQTGIAGSHFTILGQGFDPNPLNTCVFVGGRLARARVISATSTELVCEIGDVATAGSGEIEIVMGSGKEIATLDSSNISRAVSFTGTSQLATGIDFELQEVSPKSTKGDVDKNNNYCHTLEGDWKHGERICIEVHLHKGIGKWQEVEYQQDVVTVPAGGSRSPEDCARLIAASMTGLFGPDGVRASASGAKLTVTHVDGLIDGSFGSITRKEVNKRKAPQDVVAVPVNSGPPGPELDTWNKPKACQRANNCYNYATNFKTNTRAQPGRAGGNQIPSNCEGYTCEDLTNSLAADGIDPAKDGECPEGSGLICAVIGNYEYNGETKTDYHFYRKNADGTWSHKPGGGPATTKDSDGNTITDPNTAARDIKDQNGNKIGEYDQVCGYFCVKRDETTVWKNLDVAALFDDLQPHGITAGTPGAVDANPPPQMQAILDWWSGQENPDWFLTDAEANTIKGMLNAATPSANPNWNWPFGYRGFSLVPGCGQIGFGGDQIHVFDGYIQVSNGIHDTYFVDDVGMEDYVRNLAIAAGLTWFFP